MERGDFVSHWYKYDNTKRKYIYMDWCVGSIETLYIVSQIGL